MSDHNSSYNPQSRLAKWFDERLPVMRMAHGQFVDFPTPRNLNYLWTFGGILSFMLVVMILSGLVLSMHYQPSERDAFNAVEAIRRDVNYGWLLLSSSSAQSHSLPISCTPIYFPPRFTLPL